MENWVTEVIKILVGAIAGVLLTELFPTIKNYFKRSSDSLKKRSLDTIKEKYMAYRRYHENHSTLIVRSIRYLSLAMVHCVILGSFLGVSLLALPKRESYSTFFDIIPGLIGFYTGYIITRLADVVTVIDAIADFDNFREETIKKLIKLGGNPEDLDKEEE